MTEQEWLTATNPRLMLDFLQGSKASYRKLRLFACAACHNVWHLLVDDRSRRAIETTERWCDGLTSDDELNRAYEEAGKVCFAMSEKSSGALEQDLPMYPQWCASVAAWDAAASIDEESKWARCNQSVPLCVSSELEMAALTPFIDAGKERSGAALRETRKSRCALLRDIFGNPFRPASRDPSWKTTSVKALAQQIYDLRRFDQMPILADALEEAGSDNEEILRHCRGPGPHVRGCWVLDWVLGKE